MKANPILQIALVCILLSTLGELGPSTLLRRRTKGPATLPNRLNPTVVILIGYDCLVVEKVIPGHRL